MKVAIQGQLGSFHHQVALEWFGPDTQLVECTSFSDVFHSFSHGQADAIVAAVENTAYGSINEVYQLIEQCPAPIIGERRISIRQQLLGVDGTDLRQVQTVYSHPVALAQCRDFLEATLPQAHLVEFFDTAGAAAHVKTANDPTKVAIASETAATLHNLAILRPNVHDAEHNLTRFVILATTPPPDEPNRASLVVTTNHQPGALVEVLQQFAVAGINLAKLQSQPIIGKPWQYKFFMVVDAAGEQLQAVIETISNNHAVQLLGEYRRDDEN